MSQKVLFICKERLDDYGYDKSVGLINSAVFISNYLNSINVPCKVVTVLDYNSIDKEVFYYKPTIVVIEAIWVTPKKFNELLAIPRYKGVTWIVRIHSKVAFLACEGMAFQWLSGYQTIEKNNKNFYVSTNSKETYRDIDSVFGFRKLYLPNIYMPESYPNSAKQKDSYLNVGCFGAIRILKNQLIQAISAINYGNSVGKNIKFHINATRIEGGNSIYKNLVSLFKNVGGHQLIEHPWLTHDKFIELVQNMDIGLQVSYSETFNIVTADFVACKIPVVVSDEIDWVSKFFRTNCNDSKDITDKIHIAISCSSICTKMNSLALNWYNAKSKKKWNECLDL